MADIRHEFPIRAPAERVYEAISSPDGLDCWWTLRSAGQPADGTTYELFFGEPYDWRAVVLKENRPTEIAWRFVVADEEWTGTILRIVLQEHDELTIVRFSHTGWPEPSEHFRISSFCWAMYLRLLKRYVEHGETVPYNDRLDV